MHMLLIYYLTFRSTSTFNVVDPVAYNRHGGPQDYPFVAPSAELNVKPIIPFQIPVNPAHKDKLGTLFR